MERKLKLLFFLFLFQKCSGIIYELNETQYDRMPPVFHLDPYEACLRQPGALYCTVDAALVSDNTSPLLDMIQEYTASVKTHFNHTSIVYGLCVTKTCKDIYRNRTTDLKTTLEGCLNKTINENYGLKTRVAESFYCNREKTKLNIDAGDLIVAGVILTLALLNIVGSLYDFHFTSDKAGEGIKFFLCFSIRQNWRRLVKPITDHPDTRLKRLKGVNGIRLLSIMFIVMGHSFWPAVNFNDNPHKIEMMYHILINHVLYNGTLIVQTFFVMSSFLHVYRAMIKAEKRPRTLRTLLKAIVSRWWRLTPAYAVVLAVTSTWQRYAGSGPLWQNFILDEVKDCRESWWLNLLYLNNYRDGNTCMAQTWYLAADMQLYIVGAILCLTLKTNRSRKIVLSIFFVLGVALPCLHIYLQDLDAILIISPESGRSFFMRDKTFNNVYKRGHTNLACYILGMALGYLVYHCQNTGLDLNKYRKYRYVYWMLLPLAFGILLLGKIFYEDGPSLPLYFRVAYAGLVKPLFGLLPAICIAANIFKYEDVGRGVLEWDGWTSMSRVSYSAYLLHIFVVRAVAGSQKTLNHLVIQDISMIISVAGVVLLTFGASYVFYMLVESPIARLVSLCLFRKGANTSGKTDVHEGKSEENGDNIVSKV